MIVGGEELQTVGISVVALVLIVREVVLPLIKAARGEGFSSGVVSSKAADNAPPKTSITSSELQRERHVVVLKKLEDLCEGQENTRQLIRIEFEKTRRAIYDLRNGRGRSD